VTARGIMTAIARGTFTVGHGPRIAAQRIRQSALQERPNPTEISMDPEVLNKGKALMGRLGQQSDLRNQIGSST